MRKSTSLMSSWKAESKSGDALQFELCKGGYFSSKDEYGLKVVGKTDQKKLTGKNLILSKPERVTGTKYGVMYSVEKDGSLHLNGTSTAAVFIHTYRGDVRFPLPDGNRKFSLSYHGNFTGTSWMIRLYDENMSYKTAVYSSNGKSTWDFSSNTVYRYAQFQIQINGAGIAFDNAVIYPQVEYGGITDYEPYCGGVPAPSVDSPQPIQCVKQGSVLICCTCEITVPCDLYEGDIWYPMTGKVERYNHIIDSYAGEAMPDAYYSTTGELSSGAKVVFKLSNPVVEMFDPQPIWSPSGTLNLYQTPLDLSADLSATMLVRR